MVRFVQGVHGGRALVLREDFAGPASLAGAWVDLSRRHRAVAVDRDPEPLSHARKHRRLRVRVMDVLACKERADCVALLNFAVCELHARGVLVAYFKHLRRLLHAGGVVVLDIYGGENAFARGAIDAKRRLPDGREIVYTWEQVEADATTGMVRNAMHFDVRPAKGAKRKIKGGGAREQLRWPGAFAYRWRLWSIPELRDAMAEGGFGHTEVHAGLGDAVDGRGRVQTRAMGAGERLEGDWVAYVVGRAGGG